MVKNERKSSETKCRKIWQFRSLFPQEKRNFLCRRRSRLFSFFFSSSFDFTMSKLSFVILSLVPSLLFHLLLFPFNIATVNGQQDTTAEIVSQLTDNAPDSVEVVQLDKQTIFEFEKNEDMHGMGMGISNAKCDNGRVSFSCSGHNLQWFYGRRLDESALKNCANFGCCFIALTDDARKF